MVRSPEQPSEKPRGALPPDSAEFKVRAPVPKEKPVDRGAMKAKISTFLNKDKDPDKPEDFIKFDCTFIEAGEKDEKKVKKFSDSLSFIKGSTDFDGNDTVDKSNVAYIAVLTQEGNPEEELGVAAFDTFGKMIGYAD